MTFLCFGNGGGFVPSLYDKPRYELFTGRKLDKDDSNKTLTRMINEVEASARLNPIGERARNGEKLAAYRECPRAWLRFLIQTCERQV